MERLTIGKLAGSSHVSVQAIRYYEREGLLDAPVRNASGYRLYDEAAVQRLVFIHRAQELGFTLKEIRGLIALETDRTADCSAVRTAAVEKLHIVEEKLADLQRMKVALTDVVHSCTGHRPTAECEILHCLNSGGSANGHRTANQLS